MSNKFMNLDELLTFRWVKASNDTCFYCEVKLKLEERTIDHIIPISEGGRSFKTNMVVACATCNDAKGSQCVFTFIENHIKLKGKIRQRVKARLRLYDKELKEKTGGKRN